MSEPKIVVKDGSCTQPDCTFKITPKHPERLVSEVLSHLRDKGWGEGILQDVEGDDMMASDKLEAGEYIFRRKGDAPVGMLPPSLDRACRLDQLERNLMTLPLKEHNSRAVMLLSNYLQTYHPMTESSHSNMVVRGSTSVSQSARDFAAFWPLLDREEPAKKFVDVWRSAVEVQENLPKNPSLIESQSVERTPHVNILLGAPGTGKTSLIEALPRLVTNMSSEVLGGGSFEMLLRDAMSGNVPLQFVQDFAVSRFCDWSPLLKFIASFPSRWLALTTLSIYCVSRSRTLTFSELLLKLPDELLVLLRAPHVFDAIHRHHGKERSFTHFVLDEAAAIRGEHKLALRAAFTGLAKELTSLPANVFVAYSLCSTRLAQKAVVGESPDGKKHEEDDACSMQVSSDILDRTTSSGGQAFAKTYLMGLKPGSSEKLFRATCTRLEINVPAKLPFQVQLVLDYAGPRPRHVQAGVAAMGGSSTSLYTFHVDKLQKFIAGCTWDELAGAFSSARDLMLAQEYMKAGRNKFHDSPSWYPLMRIMVVRCLRRDLVHAKQRICDDAPTTWSEAIESGYVEVDAVEEDFIRPRMAPLVLESFISRPEANLRPLLNLFNYETASYHYEEKEQSDLCALAFLLQLEGIAQSGQKSSLREVLRLKEHYNADHAMEQKILLGNLNLSNLRMPSQWTREQYDTVVNKIAAYYAEEKPVGEQPVLFYQSASGAPRPDCFGFLPLDTKGVLKLELQMKETIGQERSPMKDDEIEELIRVEMGKMYNPSDPNTIFILCLDRPLASPTFQPPDNCVILDLKKWVNLYTELGKFKRDVYDVMYIMRQGSAGQEEVGKNYTCPVPSCQKLYMMKAWLLKHLESFHQRTPQDAQRILEELSEVEPAPKRVKKDS